MMSRLWVVELIRRVYSEISKVPYINHLCNQDLDEDLEEENQPILILKVKYKVKSSLKGKKLARL